VTAQTAVRGLEERGFNAWPALYTVVVDGWLLRLAQGHTKRANSVNALSPGGRFATVVAAAETLYRVHSLPLIFRLSPLAGAADDALAGMGFRSFDPAMVMTGPVGPAAVADPRVSLRPAPDAAWSAGFAAANGVPLSRRPTHERILASIRLPAAFAVLGEGGSDVAYGLAVVERGMSGLFDIVTVPGARRRGTGRRLVGALLAWGAAQGATSAYLQVSAANAPAIALYEGCGFRQAYRYHYRMRP
jgi:ribosomal protein S18 acetylase RimI-like enzyme